MVWSPSAVHLTRYVARLRGSRNRDASNITRGRRRGRAETREGGGMDERVHSTALVRRQSSGVSPQTWMTNCASAAAAMKLAENVMVATMTVRQLSVFSALMSR